MALDNVLPLDSVFDQLGTEPPELSQGDGAAHLGAATPPRARSSVEPVYTRAFRAEQNPLVTEEPGSRHSRSSDQGRDTVATRIA